MSEINILVIGTTLDFIGTIMLGYTVLAVHWHIVKEHRLDQDVFRAIKKERIIGFSGLLLIAIGFLLQVYSYIFI